MSSPSILESLEQAEYEERSERSGLSSAADQVKANAEATSALIGPSAVARYLDQLRLVSLSGVRSPLHGLRGVSIGVTLSHYESSQHMPAFPQIQQPGALAFAMQDLGQPALKIGDYLADLARGARRVRLRELADWSVNGAELDWQHLDAIDSAGWGQPEEW